jgi:2'-5' RNA ligase
MDQEPADRMIRAFLAVELPEELRGRLAQLQQDLKRRLSQDMPRNVRVSWARPASIHLTLKFLGDIDEQLISPMHEAIGQAVRRHPPVYIPLDRLGSFPRVQQPRVLWVGPDETWEGGGDAQKLTAVNQVVEACCRVLDFAPENRPLSPHLTLARIKEGQHQFGQMLARSGVMDHSVALGSLPIGSLALMKSELNPSGSIYTKLWEVGLGGGS